MFNKLKSKMQSVRAEYDQELAKLDDQISKKRSEIAKQKGLVSLFNINHQMAEVEKEIELYRKEAIGRVRFAIEKHGESGQIFSIKNLFVNANNGDPMPEGLLGYVDVEKIKSDIQSMFEDLIEKGKIPQDRISTEDVEKRKEKLSKLQEELMELKSLRDELTG